jgi:pimeloyl-ACP methyl ester carboxylesterase
MTVITIDGQVIEYRLERRGAAAVLILHGGHMSARCRFGEGTFLDAGCSVLVVSRPGYGGRRSPPDHPRPSSPYDWLACAGDSG